MGGPSAEHEVSLETGKVVLASLDKSKYNAKSVVIPKNSRRLTKLDKDTDVVFIAMHGAFGEDGTVQQLLEDAGIPYTGSDAHASTLAMDKIKSGELFTFHGLSVPKYIAFSKTDWHKNQAALTASILQLFEVEHRTVPRTVVIKPSNCGSSVGISIVKKPSKLPQAAKLAFSYSPTIMAQEYISGHEVTCAVLDNGNGRNAIALPPIQIIPKTSNFFDYKAKYTAGASEEITPPHFPQNIIHNIQRAALKAHKILDCSGMSRTDMIVRDGKIYPHTRTRASTRGTKRSRLSSGVGVYILETNTIPGMTKTSLLPQATSAAGITFPELLDKIINAALNRK